MQWAEYGGGHDKGAEQRGGQVKGHSKAKDMTNDGQNMMEVADHRLSMVWHDMTWTMDRAQGSAGDETEKRIGHCGRRDVA